MEKQKILAYLLSIDKTLKKSYFLEDQCRDLNRIAEQNECIKPT